MESVVSSNDDQKVWLGIASKSLPYVQKVLFNFCPPFLISKVWVEIDQSLKRLQQLLLLDRYGQIN